MTPYKNQTVHEKKKNTNQYKNEAISPQTLELPYKRVEEIIEGKKLLSRFADGNDLLTFKGRT